MIISGLLLLLGIAIMYWILIYKVDPEGWIHDEIRENYFLFFYFLFLFFFFMITLFVNWDVSFLLSAIVISIVVNEAIDITKIEDKFDKLLEEKKESISEKRKIIEIKSEENNKEIITYNPINYSIYQDHYYENKSRFDALQKDIDKELLDYNNNINGLYELVDIAENNKKEYLKMNDFQKFVFTKTLKNNSEL